MTEPQPKSDPALESLALSHGPLTFTDEGPRQAPVLLALHGIPGSGRAFRYLAPQVTGHVRLVRVDLPGFGGSAPSAEAVVSLDGRSRVLVALADHLGLERFAVLGHSLGGASALVLAASEPTRVNGLVLLASVGLRPHRGLAMSPRRARLVSRAFAVPLVKHALVRMARERYKQRRFPGADELDAKAFAVHFKAIGATDFEQLRRAARSPLPRTLIAWARDDHMVENEIPEELARALPAARTLVFEAGGHNIQKTQAVALGTAIRETLGA